MYLSIIELMKLKGYQTNFHGSIVKEKKIQVIYQQKWIFPESIERKKLWWEGPDFLKKHDVKLQSHENVCIEFENFVITETPTLLVLNQGKNYGIDKTIDICKFSNVNKLYRTTAWVKQFCVNLKNILNNRKKTILLKIPEILLENFWATLDRKWLD